ncbi:hypothetical protein Tco_0734349 [Tanacetum coccineum]
MQQSFRLVPNPPPSTPFVPPSRSDYDLLFQPLFDELLTPPHSVDHTAPEVIAPIVDVVSLEPPRSNLIHHLLNNSNDPYFGIQILDIPSDQSSLSDIIHIIMHPDHQISKHNSKLTKDHPLENIIAFLAAIEPKTYKDALIQSYWIKAMQEELNEFERLGVVVSPKAQWDPTAVHPLEGKNYFCPRGIFINQSKYAIESLKKYGFDSCDPVDTPMVEKSKLDEDKEGKAVDPSHYCGSDGHTSYYLTFQNLTTICYIMCAPYQAWA